MASTQTKLQIALSQAIGALHRKEYKECKSYLKVALKLYKQDKSEPAESTTLFYNQQHYFHLFYVYGLYCQNTIRKIHHPKAIKSYKKSLKFIHMDISRRLHENYNKIYKQISSCYLEMNEYIQSLRFSKMINHNFLNTKEQYNHLMFMLELYFILEDLNSIKSIIKQLDEWKHTKHDIRYYTIKIRYLTVFAINNQTDNNYTGILAPSYFANEWFMKGLELMNNTNTNTIYKNDFLSWSQYANITYFYDAKISFDPNQSISSIYAKSYILKYEMKESNLSIAELVEIYIKLQDFLDFQKQKQSSKCINVPFAQFCIGILLYYLGYLYFAKKYIFIACKTSPELPIIKQKGIEWELRIIRKMTTCDWCRAQYECKSCKNCRNVYYCSKYCQKRGWKNGHKLMCFNTNPAITNGVSYSIGYYKN
eukprot:259253_1